MLDKLDTLLLLLPQLEMSVHTRRDDEVGSERQIFMMTDRAT